MAAFLNALMSDVANRIVAFLMDKFPKVTTPTTEGMRLHDLQRLLLRVGVIVEEAEGRYNTNPLLAYQLNMLRKEMYRGYLTLDNLRIHGNEELKAKDHDVSNSFFLSKVNAAKRLFFSAGNKHMEKDIHQVLDNLNNIIVDMSEFVTTLSNYPPLYRQPYSMHFYVGKCMFGRQMEVDRVIGFLMQTENPIMKNVGVLPIVGPAFVGKSTLVAHIYNDERVCNHFSRIVVLTGDEINYENLQTTFKDSGLTMHQGNALGHNDRLLTIVEFSEDVDEVVWNMLYSSASSCLGTGSKIIVTSRSDRIINFGTTQALVLNFLPLEAYWYFFKILTFGSVDSNDHPELESIAMNMAREMNGSFVAANISSGFLRNNLTVEYWTMQLTMFRAYIQRNIALFGEHPYALLRKNKHTCCSIYSNDRFLVYSQHLTCLANDNNVPAITVDDLRSGSLKCEGEFDMLLWKSHILPYKSYVVRCMTERKLQ